MGKATIMQLQQIPVIVDRKRGEGGSGDLKPLGPIAGKDSYQSPHLYHLYSNKTLAKELVLTGLENL